MPPLPCGKLRAAPAVGGNGRGLAGKREGPGCGKVAFRAWPVTLATSPHLAFAMPVETRNAKMQATPFAYPHRHGAAI